MLASRFFRSALAAASRVAIGILSVATTGPAHAAAPLGAPAVTNVRGLDLANLDTTCKACDDFWRFGTGGWSRRTKIPAGYSSWESFSEIYERNLAVLHTIVNRAAADAATTANPDEARVGIYYAACNDQAKIEATGLQALQPELDRIAAISSPTALVAEVARLDVLGIDNGLNFGSEADARDSAKTIAAVGFGGLGMPDRDYYLNAGKARIRAAYARYLETQFKNLGEAAPTAKQHARAVIALETGFAKATPPNADLRDPLATYHPMPVARLSAVAPHIAWPLFLGAFGQSHVRALDLSLPTFTTAFDHAISTEPLDTWKAALRSHLVTGSSLALPKTFDDAQFAFFGRLLEGTREPKPRWKRCVAATDNALGDPLGKLYVAQVFPPTAKTRVQELVSNLQATLHDDIATLAWMSPVTRREAEVKLAAYVKKIGYPDHWIDFSSVSFGATDRFYDDVATAQNFASRLDYTRIGKPTDRWRWGMTPPTVNAYYNPSNNEIVFPAGILQPPFFPAAADDAVTYGAIGAIIGHEMTHGFDDQGRLYDARGNLRDWWTPSDAAHFKRRAQCIIDQFNRYHVEPGVHENGRLITGEAIADLGGATIAYRAFTHTAEFKSHAKTGDYTPQQRFFLAYAQAWREVTTPEYARQGVLVDPHPLNRFRLIGTVSNMPAFAAAFGCALPAPMVRKDRCEIW